MALAPINPPTRDSSNSSGRSSLPDTGGPTAGSFQLLFVSSEEEEGDQLLVFGYCIDS